MGYLWAIAQRHMDEYGVRSAALARRMGTAPQTLDSWKNRGVRSLPTRELLEALARETRTPYAVVLKAALQDIDYLPKESDPSGDTAPTSPPPVTPGDTLEEQRRWDRRAAPLRAAGYTDRAVEDALGGPRPSDPHPGDGPGEVDSGTGHITAGHEGSDSRRRRMS